MQTNEQAVVRKHNKPRPRVAHRGIARFLRIERKCNQRRPMVTPHLPENVMQIGPAVFRNLANKETKIHIHTDIQTKKSIENNTPSPDVSGTG